MVKIVEAKNGGENMSKKIIIIEGYLASGKSTFALRLSKDIRVPCFVKDTFKIALCSNISVPDRSESSRFSTVTFDGMMYAAERLIEMCCLIIIEGNFVPFGVKKIDEAGRIKELIDKHKCSPLTFKFKGDTQVLYERFIEREKTPERGDVNRMNGDASYNDFKTWCENLDAFDVGGKTIEIDTTNFDNVDFNGYISFARQFIGKSF